MMAIQWILLAFNAVLIYSSAGTNVHGSRCIGSVSRYGKTWNFSFCWIF